MSVLNYLEETASNAILDDDEKKSIETSISTLQTRLENYFGDNILDHFQFGSSTRGTILPRKMDEDSDIDYMVVFKDDNSTPQTFLSRLKKFVEAKYSTSEIYQSSPAIVLELNHIKFELVPALQTYLTSTPYKIPDKASSYNDWIYTNPHGFKEALTEKNKNNNNEIKPMIRLVKYWNAENRPSFLSYGLEKDIVDKYYYSCSNLKDYFFKYMEDLSTSTQYSDTLNKKIERMHNIISNVKYYENQGQYSNAENEIKKLLPEVYSSTK